MSSVKTQTQLQPFLYHILNPQVRSQTFVSLAATVSPTTHWAHSPVPLPPSRCPGHKHRCKSAVVAARPPLSALLLTLAAGF